MLSEEKHDVRKSKENLLNSACIKTYIIIISIINSKEYSYGLTFVKNYFLGKSTFFVFFKCLNIIMIAFCPVDLLYIFFCELTK